MIPNYFGGSAASGDKDDVSAATPVTQAEKMAASAFRSPTQLAARFGSRSPLRGSQASVASGGSRPASPSRREAHPDRGNKVFREISGVTKVTMKKPAPAPAPAPAPSNRNHDSFGDSTYSDGSDSRDRDIDPLGNSLQSALQTRAFGFADAALNSASDYIHKGVERVDSAIGSFLPTPPGMLASVPDEGSTLCDTVGDTATLDNTVGDTATLGNNTVGDDTATYEGNDGSLIYPNAPSRDTTRGSASILRSGTTRTSGDSFHQVAFGSASSTKSKQSTSARSTGVKSAGSKSRSSAGARSGNGMDLRHNDNSFFVITDLILSRFKKEIVSKSPTMMLSDSDRAHLDRTVPIQARDKFVEAVRYRLAIARENGTVTPVLKQCCALGLDRNRDDDNILYARMNTIISINQSNEDDSDEEDNNEDDIDEATMEKEETLNDEVDKDEDTFEMVERVAPAPEQPRERQIAPKVPDVLDVTILEPNVRLDPTVDDDDPATEEERARQELMEELRDASNLMAESVTPEAAKFWRKQVVELQTRLREMNGESTDNGPILRSATSDSMSVLSVQSESVADSTVDLSVPEKYERRPKYEPVKPVVSAPVPTQKPILAPALVPVPVKSKPAPPKVEAKPVPEPEEEPEPVPVPAPKPKPLSFPEIVASRSNVSGGGMSRSSRSPASGIQQSPSQDSMFRSPLQRSPLMVHDKSERLMYKKQELAKSASADPSLDGLPIVDVVAPADLPGGYTFEAEIEGRRFLATVPFGGVREGETFCCFMRDLETVSPSTIPIGRWRDSILGCFRHGYLHATVLLAVFCPLLAIGQVMTRMELNFIGLPLGNRKGPTTWTILTRIVGFWALMNFAVIASFQAKVTLGLGLSDSDLISILVINVAMYVFTVYVTANTRKTIRSAFHINEKHCFDFEDLFFSTFMLPFAICQMSRHTASFEEYNAVCFSSNGLPPDVKVFKRKPYDEPEPPAAGANLV